MFALFCNQDARTLAQTYEFNEAIIEHGRYL